MAKTLEERVKRLEDVFAIQQVLGLYCRAVDRMDLELLRSVYHPDAADDHGTFVGNADEFCDFVMEVQGRNSYSSHTIANPVIDLDGDVASVECVYRAYTRVPGGWDPVSTYFGDPYAARARDNGTLEQEHEHICGGRYLDRFERRDDVWRIAARRVTNEWNQCRPISELWEGRLAAMRLPGTRDRHDPVYSNSIRPAMTLSAW